MNLKRIDGAIAARDTELDDAGKARLAFFRGIWGIQQAAQDRLAASGAPAYTVPELDQLDAWYWDDATPVFAQAPVSVDSETLTRVCTELAAYIADNAGIDDEDVATLQAFDWTQLSSVVPDISLAGSDPADYLALVARKLEEQGAAGADTILMVLSLGLRALLEPAQSSVMAAEQKAALAGYTTHAKPLRCPCCGGEPTLAYVGPTPASSGNGRILYCGQCGATWEVERVRCPHCGTRSQEKLHYVSIEGDDAHRLYACDECGRYTRTFFAADATGIGAAFVPEVEDVVMATLDAVAQSPAYEAALERARATDARQ
ncbi:MAG: formate dehydrogenase accessory protein FdhE [Coriobacteriia bacterium]|nr:formate dehydrogenase accessory protein FdhE [Coriobacteriia bacterium]MBS5477428.1 formate dehydrogenase accessory protein FdhE [Coriobacteriia bacterium]